MDQPELDDEELAELYACLMQTLGEQAATGTASPANWVTADRPEGAAFLGWTNFALAPYQSGTHGMRFATNHVNPVGAEAYGRYEAIGEMPVGGIVAKPTFSVMPDGEAKLETLFLMERAATGSLPESNDWIYTSINADGSLWGRTGGFNSDGMAFCVICHQSAGDSDDLLFLPDELRR